MIRPLTDVADREAAIAALTRIFFESSTRTHFVSEADRSRFLELWTGWYLRHAPQDVLLAIDDDGAVSGYLTGCRDSAAAVELARSIPRYGLFADLFPRFPAHLHVNVASHRRGAGIGRTLVDTFAKRCCVGVHVITAPTASNAEFYRRQGFIEAHQRDGLLFLGRNYT